MSTIDRAFPSAHALSLPAIPATPEHAPAFSLSMLDAVVQQAGAEQIQAPGAAPDQSPVRPKIQFSLPYPLPGAVEPEDQVIAENGVQAGGSNAVILCPCCGKRYSDAAMLEMHKRTSCRASFYGGRSLLDSVRARKCAISATMLCFRERPRVLQSNRNPRRLSS